MCTFQAISLFMRIDDRNWIFLEPKNFYNFILHRLYFKTLLQCVFFFLFLSLPLLLSICIFFFLDNFSILFGCTDILNMIHIMKLHHKLVMQSKRFIRSIQIIMEQMRLAMRAAALAAPIINNHFPITTHMIYYRRALIVNHRHPALKMRWVVQILHFQSDYRWFFVDDMTQSTMTFRNNFLLFKFFF